MDTWASLTMQSWTQASCLAQAIKQTFDACTSVCAGFFPGFLQKDKAGLCLCFQVHLLNLSASPSFGVTQPKNIQLFTPIPVSLNSLSRTQTIIEDELSDQTLTTQYFVSEGATQIMVCDSTSVDLKHSDHGLSFGLG